jgi:DNA-binding SARP family transcriptional activator/predicted transcriptional regulator
MLMLEKEQPPRAMPDSLDTMGLTMQRPFVRLLGEPSVTLGQPHRFIADRRYQVLVYLAHAGTWVSRDKIAALFYGDTNQSAARSNFRKILFKIKNLEWLENLEQNDDALRWQVETDVARFQNAIEAQNWREAVTLYSGQFLQGFNEDETDFNTWLETERLRLEQRYHHAAEQYIESLEQKGDVDTALLFLRKILERDPLLEATHRRVIALEFRRGNSEAAFEQFERCREILQKELGVEPEEETLGLLRKLEQGTTQAKYAIVLKNPDAVADAPQVLFGREKLLQEISSFLQQGERVLAQGFGGMGKTALAATLAKTFLQEKKKNVLWLQVGVDNPDVVLEALARPFDAAQDLAKAEDKALYLKEVLREHSLSLLVLDDVWNAYTLSKVLEAVPQGLPVLVTSRQRYSRIERVYVDRLERNAALELLKHYADRPLSPRSPVSLSETSGQEDKKTRRQGEELNNLCDLLGDHPFTLRIAGLNIRDGATVEDLLGRIRSAPHDLKIPNDFKEAGRESAASLLSASLESLSDLEYELFMTYGILASPTVTPQLLSECTNRDLTQVEEALFNLVSRGLAERVSKPDSDYVAYRLHDLAHSYTRTNRIQRHTTLIRAALTHLREHKHDVTLLELDIANLLSAAERCKDLEREDELLSIMYLLTVEGSYYTARGHGSRSVAMLKEVAALAEEKGRLEEAQQMYLRLGAYYTSFPNNHVLAFEHYQHARTLAVRTGNQTREAISLGLMSISKTLGGESSDEFVTEAYRIAQATQDDECLAQVLGQLGYITLSKTDMQSANRYLKEALEVLSRLSHRGVSIQGSLNVEYERFYTLLNLAETEYRLGDLAKGEAIFNESLELARELHNEVWLGYAYYGMGEMYQYVNLSQQAEAHMLEALKLFQNNNCTKDVEAVMSFLKAGNYILEEVQG